MIRVYRLQMEIYERENTSKKRHLFMFHYSYEFFETGCLPAATPRLAFGREKRSLRLQQKRAEPRLTETNRAQIAGTPLTPRDAGPNLTLDRFGSLNLALTLALFRLLWQCCIEMDTSLGGRTSELQALVVKFIGLRSAAHLRARLLRGLAIELNSAYSSGLTRKEIWNALREHGYQGSYPQFCKTCSRLLGFTGRQVQPIEMRSQQILPPHGEERAAAQNGSTSEVQQQSQTQEREKPLWQRQREEAAARLDREAEEYRRREASKLKPKLFTNQPFEPPK